MKDRNKSRRKTRKEEKAKRKELTMPKPEPIKQAN